MEWLYVDGKALVLDIDVYGDTALHVKRDSRGSFDAIQASSSQHFNLQVHASIYRYGIYRQKSSGWHISRVVGVSSLNFIATNWKKKFSRLKCLENTSHDCK